MDSEIDKRIKFATITCDSVNWDLCRALLQCIMAVDIRLQTGIVNARSERVVHLSLYHSGQKSWVYV